MDRTREHQEANILRERRRRETLDKLRRTPEFGNRHAGTQGGEVPKRRDVRRGSPQSYRIEALQRPREVPQYDATRGEPQFGSDRSGREIERRIREADRLWREHPEWRREFSRQFGIESHRIIEEKIRKAEAARGRREGPTTYEVERTISCPDGSTHRVDYWDHEARAIVDIKPVEEGQTVGEVVEKHKDQLLRYARAAERCEGEPVKEVGIKPYPGTGHHEEGG